MTSFTPLSSTESTLTIDPSTFSMDGWQFRATIDGVEPSSVAEVKVYKQVVIADILNATLCPNTGESFSVNITDGTGPYTYDWKRVSLI